MSENLSSMPMLAPGEATVEPLYASQPRCTQMDLLVVLHLRPMSHAAVDAHLDFELLTMDLTRGLGRAEPTESAAQWAPLGSGEVELCFNEQEGDGPFSHIVCDISLSAVDEASSAGAIQSLAEEALRRARVSLAAGGFDAALHDIRYTKRMAFMEQGRIRAA